MLNILRESKGSVAVLAALAITCLVGFAALVVDMGNLYVTRTQLATMADAAALAAARNLIPQIATASPTSTAIQVAAENGRQPGDQVIVNTTARSVSVTVTRKVNLLFAPILGIATSDVTASAQATAGVLVSATGVVPFGVEKQELQYGVPYVLKAGGGGGSSGNYDALALGGNGADVYEYNIANGYNSVLRVGDQVYTKTGNMSGPTSDGVNTRISSDPGATFPPQSFDSPRVITVPILESLDVNGHKEVTIAGFANFFLEGVGGSGNENYVTGKFIQVPRDGDISSSAPFYGAYNVKLIR